MQAQWSSLEWCESTETPWQENRRPHNGDKSVFFTHWQHLAVKVMSIIGLGGNRECCDSTSG